MASDLGLQCLPTTLFCFSSLKWVNVILVQKTIFYEMTIYNMFVFVSDGSNGGSCLPDSNCTDINAVCDDSKICSCKPGYVNVAGLCRKTGM